MHAAHPSPPPFRCPLEFSRVIARKTWMLIMGEGEIKLLAPAGVSLLRSFSHNYRDDNGKVKKKQQVYQAKQQLSHFFVHFFPITARLQCENV